MGPACPALARTHVNHTHGVTVDIRIGITQSAREIALEVDETVTSRDALKTAIDDALAGKTPTLWLTDKKGRDVAVPTARISFVEIGSADSGPRIGFGG